MSDVAVTVQQIGRAGITPAYAGSLLTTNTYLVPNDGNVFLHLKKTGAGDCVVSVATPNTVDGLAIADLTETVGATSGDRMFGPFPVDNYGSTLSVTLSEITGLTMAAIAL